jgi:hypothetical protein
MSSPRTPVVGQRVIDNYDFVRSLCRTRSSKKTARLLAAASEEQLLTLVEIALNILKGFRLKPCQTQKLYPLADTVRRLSRARSARTTRVIVQKGGNPLLSALLLPIAVEVGRYLLQRDGAENGTGA